MFPMELNEYQNRAKTTALYKDRNQALICTVLGLNGEAGEVAEKFKKIIRDRDGGISALADLSETDLQAIRKELGDVLWYVAVLAETLGLSLEQVAQDNLDKLKSRWERGVIRGSGDHR